MQYRKLVAFFSRKLNSYLKKYGNYKKELLSISEIFKEFYLILRSQRIIIHTDHKNLTYSGTIHENTRTIRQRMHIEEFSPTIVCVKGNNNHIADTMFEILQGKKSLTSEKVFSLIEEYYATTRKGVKQE